MILTTLVISSLGIHVCILEGGKMQVRKKKDRFFPPAGGTAGLQPECCVIIVGIGLGPGHLYF